MLWPVISAMSNVQRGFVTDAVAESIKSRFSFPFVLAMLPCCMFVANCHVIAVTELSERRHCPSSPHLS